MESDILDFGDHHTSEQQTKEESARCATFPNICSSHNHLIVATRQTSSRCFHLLCNSAKLTKH